MVVGRGRVRFRVVRLGGQKVRKVRDSAADAHDAADVFLYRDSPIAPLFDMRRRFKAVMGVLDSMILHGFTLARTFELSAHWEKILSIGPLYHVSFDDLHAVEGAGLGNFCRIVGDFHYRLSDFIHGIVVHRRDEAVKGVFSAGGGRGSVEAWYTSALDIEEVLAGAADSHVHLFVADVIKSFDTVDRSVVG